MFISDDPIYSSIDNPPDPYLTVFSSLDSTFIKPSIPIQPPPTVHPPSDTSHVFTQHPSPSSNDSLGSQGASAFNNEPVLPLQPLSLDDFGWFDTPNSFKASCAAAASSAATFVSSAPDATALNQRDDTSGFDQLSLFDEVCASALSTPITPNLDTPDLTTSHPTPLFASEDVASDASLTNLEDLWVTPVSSLTPAQGSSLDLDFGLTSPLPALSFASTNQSGQNDTSMVVGAAQDSTDVHARLQAETALLDFVLFDDIAPPSPISTLSTPVINSFASPSSPVELEVNQEDSTNELALQLVAAAAASMTSQQSSPSTIESQATDIIGGLFSDVDLSPAPIGLASPVTASSLNSPLMAQDWSTTLGQIPQTFSFDFSGINTTDAADASATTSSTASPNVFSMPMSSPTSSSPMLPTTASPQLDLSLLLTLLNQQQQQQQQQQQLQQLLSPLIASMIPALTSTMLQQMDKATTVACSATTTTCGAADTAMTQNPLKRKSDEMTKETGEESCKTGPSGRQFMCSICGRAFSRLFNLNTHERTHDRSKARLFACPEQGCKKSFTRKNDLQRHQISIHGVTHIYSCSKCDKPFSRRDTYRRHMGLKNCEDDMDTDPVTSSDNAADA